MALEVTLEIKENTDKSTKTATIALSGALDASTAPDFKEKVEEALSKNVTALILMMEKLDYMASAGLRVLIFAKQKTGANTDIYVAKPQEMVLETLEKTGFISSVILVDSLEEVIKE